MCVHIWCSSLLCFELIVCDGSLFSQGTLSELYFSKLTLLFPLIHVLMKAKKPQSLTEAIVMKKPLTGGDDSRTTAISCCYFVPSFEQFCCHLFLSFRMLQRMTPTAGCAMMEEMCSAVISVPECSTFSALASLGHQKEMKSGTALFVR